MHKLSAHLYNVNMLPEEYALIIDSIAPLNNMFRSESDPIKKVEILWEIGGKLDYFIKKYNTKLRTLLFGLYDPFSTVKRSYITRDLGTYSHRIYKYFKNKQDIKKTLPTLTYFRVFREAIPLLFNPKYQKFVDRKMVLDIVNSIKPYNYLISQLIEIKQSILPKKNPRTQRSKDYEQLVQYLYNIKKNIKDFYKQFESIPSSDIIEKRIGNETYRDQLVVILMALASENFSSKIAKFKQVEILPDLMQLFEVSKSSNEKRSRFRKWVHSSNDLLWLAEALHALSKESDYRFFRHKLSSDLNS